MLRKNKNTLPEVIDPEHNIRDSIIKGGIWIFVLRAGERLFSLIRLIILARLLFPSDFGLFGIAILTIEVLMAFFRSGFRQALIQRKKDTELYLDTAWTLGIIRRLLLVCLLFFSSPYIAAFFKTPEATLVIRVMSVAFILRALMNISVIYFEKELEFHKYFIYQLGGILVEIIVSVGYAILFRNVWALVFGFLAGILTRCILSYVILPYKPSLNLNTKKAKELFTYGKWILGSSIFTFGSAYIDNIFVGRLLGAASLGLYQVAFRISDLPTSEITNVFHRITFPAYSKMQDDQSKLKNVYFRIMKFNITISFFFTSGIICLAPDFTRIFLGEKWIATAPIIQLLAVAVFFHSIALTASPLFKGSGHPNYELYMQLTKVSLMILTIYPLTQLLGLSGAAVCVILGTSGMILIWYPLSKSVIQASWQDYFSSLWPPFLSSLLMAGSLYLLKSFVDLSSGKMVLAALKFTGAAVIGFIIYLLVSIILFKINSEFGVGQDVKYIYKYIVKKSGKPINTAIEND